MKHIVIVGIAVFLMFFLIAFNLNDYNSRTEFLSESRMAESAEKAEKERKARDTEPNPWDRINNAKEKLQTAPPEAAQTEVLYSEITDENGEIAGYQAVENVTYDEDGNVVSFDIVGDVISVDEYQNNINQAQTEPPSTTRKIPDLWNKKETEFVIVVT